jgi:antitoxin VapB
MLANARTARLFRNNHSQAVRIPRDFELSGDEVLIQKKGDCLILKPVKKIPFRDLVMQWDSLDETLPAIEDLPAEPVDI